jgi:hydrogenase maturation protein HypF
VSERARIRVEGTVQGVGFRPFAFRLARSLDLVGFVRNDRRGVLVEAEGRPGAVADLVAALRESPPPLARVERISVERIAPTGESGFAVAPSPEGDARAAIAPDACTCGACLRELFDPANRRFRYPFTTCTDCGPRLTLATGAPYDRARTTMASFAMCPDCEAEYGDPADRRFESQTNACPACGPRVRLLDHAFAPVAADDPIAHAAGLLRGGAIVAVKGIGGFHLACDGTDGAATARLRERKGREARPFALMVSGLEAAEALVELDEEGRELLGSAARPIVIARRRPGASRIAEEVAPGCPELGVMLAYSPLHHVLLADAGRPLVMTSGNRSDKPIATAEADASRRLGGIADAFLVHDREIAARADDSVARAVAAAPHILLRRSRGHVPAPLRLPGGGPEILGAGADLKSTICLAAGERAWVSQHLGDLSDHETLQAYRRERDHLAALLDLRPRVVAHDLHPDYRSTAEAIALDADRRIAVQHHHAHFAACLAEHGETGPAVGAILDGAGLGPDDTVWGCEVLAGGIPGCERTGSLHPVRLPGGDAAAREPWRMACSWLIAASEGEAPELPGALSSAVTDAEWARVAELVRTGLASPPTTSAGRLFDAVAALCGLGARSSHEGQAAAALEWAADPAERGRLPLPVAEGEARLVLDARETIRAVVAATRAGTPVDRIAARFHNAFAVAIASACEIAAEARGAGVVCLAGGVFQNVLLVARVREELGRRGLRVLVPERLPPNDGAISYGQVAVAAAVCESP